SGPIDVVSHLGHFYDDMGFRFVQEKRERSVKDDVQLPEAVAVPVTVSIIRLCGQCILQSEFALLAGSKDLESRPKVGVSGLRVSRHMAGGKLQRAGAVVGGEQAAVELAHEAGAGAGLDGPAGGNHAGHSGPEQIAHEAFRIDGAPRFSGACGAGGKHGKPAPAPILLSHFSSIENAGALAAARL